MDKMVGNLRASCKSHVLPSETHWYRNGIVSFLRTQLIFCDISVQSLWSVIKKLNLGKNAYTTLRNCGVPWDWRRSTARVQQSDLKPLVENKWINQEKENAHWYIYTFALCMLWKPSADLLHHFQRKYSSISNMSV